MYVFFSNRALLLPLVSSATIFSNLLPPMINPPRARAQVFKFFISSILFTPLFINATHYRVTRHDTKSDENAFHVFMKRHDPS